MFNSLFLGSVFLLSHLSGRPSSFEYQNARASFVDITSAEFTIQYDLGKREARAQSQLDFEMLEPGFPIVDLRADAMSFRIDGEPIAAVQVSSPDQKTRFLVLQKNLAPGRHRLEVENVIRQDVRFGNNTVSAAFWFSDLEDGEFLEQYLPSNLEFDQYPMELLIQILGSNERHRIFTNGDLLTRGPGEFIIRFPEYYNSSAVYFHLAPWTDFEVLEENFTADSGKTTLVQVYGKRSVFSSPARFMTRAKETLAELDADYGAFPHRKMLIYAHPSFPGGMEYHGATITNLDALAHEITHSYFGRGIMPAHGDAGWIDEAIASWRDDGYQRLSAPGYRSAKMAGRSPFIRSTPMSAYTQGARLMAHLDYLLESSGHPKGLKDFLNARIADRLFKPWTTEEFKRSLEDFGLDATDKLFSNLVYGQSSAISLEFLESNQPFRRTCKFRGILSPELREKIL